MFVNRGFRGIEIFPYPDHIKQKIREIEAQIRLVWSDRKYSFYRGHETILNIDAAARAQRDLKRSNDIGILSPKLGRDFNQLTKKMKSIKFS